MLKKILKKFQIKTILKIPGHVALDRVDIWFQDEAIGIILSASAMAVLDAPSLKCANAI